MCDLQNRWYALLAGCSYGVCTGCVLLATINAHHLQTYALTRTYRIHADVTVPFY